MVANLPPTNSGRPLRILEVGAGIGTMIERLLERQALFFADYRALDQERTNASAARARLQPWAESRGLTWTAPAANRWRISGPGVEVEIHWETASLGDLDPPGDRDLVLAHAFLDLVDLDRALPRLLASLDPHGQFYFSLVFDGLTAFLPEIDARRDQEIVDAYHATMERRREGGRPTAGSQAGRRLLAELVRHGAEIVDAGSSDWLVLPGPEGYPPGEDDFLHAMLDFVESALRGQTGIETGGLEAWVERRRAQIEDRSLIFLTHQIDVLGRAAPRAAQG